MYICIYAYIYIYIYTYIYIHIHTYLLHVHDNILKYANKHINLLELRFKQEILIGWSNYHFNNLHVIIVHVIKRHSDHAAENSLLVFDVLKRRLLKL